MSDVFGLASVQTPKLTTILTCVGNMLWRITKLQFKLGRALMNIKSKRTFHITYGPIKFTLQTYQIALYSELARQAIIQCREWIKQRGFKPTPGGISAFRQEIMLLDDAYPLKRIQGAVDFFSTSMCRDLVFYVQEHRFTLPQIKSALSELDLDLIKIIIHNGADLEAYKSMFPDDTDIKNLDYLHEFEQQNPDTFRTMYTFWLGEQGRQNQGKMPKWTSNKPPNFSLAKQ